MKKKSLLLILSVLFLSALGHCQTINQLSNDQNRILAKANRHEKNGWIYLHIEGSPRDRGFQHGYLMAAEINENLRLLRTRWEHKTALEWSWYVKKAEEVLTSKVDTENLEELGGIVEGLRYAGITATLNEMVGLNGYAELIGS